MNRQSIYGVLFVLALMLGACATPLRLDPVPQQATSSVRILGIENARYYIDPAGIAELNKEAAAALQRERKYLGGKPLPPANFLALSAAVTMAHSAPACWSAGPSAARGRSSSLSPESVPAPCPPRLLSWDPPTIHNCAKSTRRQRRKTSLQNAP